MTTQGIAVPMYARIETTSKDGDQLQIEIKLADECKNGHNDFSITGTIWGKGGGRSDRNFLSGGCLHDEILAVRPDLKPFVDLHLSRETGSPMYAEENGWYWLERSYGIYQTSEHTEIEKDDRAPGIFAKHMRITQDAANKLMGRVFSADIVDTLRSKMQELKDKAHGIYGPVYLLQDAVKHMKAAGLNTDEPQRKLDEIEKECAVLRGEIKALKTTGRAIFAKFVKSQRERWQKEADAAKVMLAELAGKTAQL